MSPKQTVILCRCDWLCQHIPSLAGLDHWNHYEEFKLSHCLLSCFSFSSFKWGSHHTPSGQVSSKLLYCHLNLPKLQSNISDIRISLGCGSLGSLSLPPLLRCTMWTGAGYCHAYGAGKNWISAAPSYITVTIWLEHYAVLKHNITLYIFSVMDSVTFTPVGHLELYHHVIKAITIPHDALLSFSPSLESLSPVRRH